jgi:hypothetical protein
MLVHTGHSSPILSNPTRKNKVPLQGYCRILIRSRRWRIGGTYGVYRIQLDPPYPGSPCVAYQDWSLRCTIFVLSIDVAGDRSRRRVLAPPSERLRVSG